MLHPTFFLTVALKIDCGYSMVSMLRPKVPSCPKNRTLGSYGLRPSVKSQNVKVLDVCHSANESQLNKINFKYCLPV